MNNGIHPYDGSSLGYRGLGSGGFNDLSRAAGELFHEEAQSLPMAGLPAGEAAARNAGARAGAGNAAAPSLPAANPGAVGPTAATRIAVGQHLDAAAQKYGIPPDLLKAVAWQGSAWDPQATSFDGGHKKGVMQIDDRYHPFAQTSAAFDPQSNIEFGASQLRRSYDLTGSWDETLRAQGGQTYATVVRSLQQRQPWARYEAGAAGAGTGDAGPAASGAGGGTVGAPSGTPGAAPATPQSGNAALAAAWSGLSNPSTDNQPGPQSSALWTNAALSSSLGRATSSAATPRQQFSIFGPNGLLERRNRSGNALNPLIPPSLTPPPDEPQS
jgi:hypothetical protein